MKIDELTVEINAKLVISDSTAEKCLRLLEMWNEDNPTKFIEVHEIENGTPYPTRKYYIRDKIKGR